MEQIGIASSKVLALMIGNLNGENKVYYAA